MQGLLQPVISLQPQDGITELPPGGETVAILPSCLSMPDMRVVAVPDVVPPIPNGMSALSSGEVDTTVRGAAAESLERNATNAQSTQNVQMVPPDLTGTLCAGSNGSDNILLQTPDGSIMQIPAQVFMQTMALQSSTAGRAVPSENPSQAQRTEAIGSTAPAPGVALPSGVGHSALTGASGNVFGGAGMLSSNTPMEATSSVPQMLVANNSVVAIGPNQQMVLPGGSMQVAHGISGYSQPLPNNQAPAELLTSGINGSDQSSSAFVPPTIVMNETATSTSSTHIGIEKTVGEMSTSLLSAEKMAATSTAAALPGPLNSSILASLSSLNPSNSVSVPTSDIPSSLAIPKDGTLTSAIASGIPVSIMPGASPESVVLNQLFVPVYSNTEKGPVIELVPVKPNS